MVVSVGSFGEYFVIGYRGGMRNYMICARLLMVVAIT